MSDEETAEEEPPAVELGAGETVEGVPLARIASRLTWPHEKSRIVERAGDISIRTPDGPQKLGDVLADVEESYFDTRYTFVSAVEETVGSGSVPTVDE